MTTQAGEERGKVDSLSPRDAPSDEHSMAYRWRKIPHEVIAYQLEPRHIDDFIAGKCPLPPGVMRGRPEGYYVITIHGNRADVKPSDWIVLEPDGKHYYPVRADIFAKTYEPAQKATGGEPRGEANPSSNWRPISEAPRDGTRILVIDPEDGTIEIAYWGEHAWREPAWLHSSGEWPIAAKLFQPLPSPPPGDGEK